MAGRVRRPKQHAELLDRLTSESGNPFKSYYETLTFCAGLGYARNKQVAFDKHDEPIRWAVFQDNIDGVDALVDMLAASSTEEVEMLAPEREDDRMRIFEEFACGGLEVLTAEAERNANKPLREVVLDLILAEEKPHTDKPDLTEISEELAD